MLLPQLMNPAGGSAMGGATIRTNINQNLPGANLNQANNQQSHPRATPAARFQFVIPSENNEQFDLYGYKITKINLINFETHG